MDRIMNVNWWNPIWICVTIRISIMQVPGCNGLVVCPSSRHPDVFVSHMQLPSRWVTKKRPWANANIQDKTSASRVPRGSLMQVVCIFYPTGLVNARVMLMIMPKIDIRTTPNRHFVVKTNPKLGNLDQNKKSRKGGKQTRIILTS